MKSLCYAVVAVAALLFCGNPAWADAQADQGYFSVMGTYIDDDELAALDDGVTGGQFGFGRAIDDHWNLEAYLMAAVIDGFPGEDQTGLGADLQLMINRDGAFTPYLFIGAGYLSIDQDGASDPDGIMMNGGAGFLVDVFGDSNIALRGEYRLRSHELFDTDFRDNLFSLGFQFPFGGGEPAVRDSDGDGVSDGYDRCPGTPAGTDVDERGCAADTDNDGVANDADRCPNTPAGTRVDGNGCPLDADGDGVADDRDHCPGTPRGVRVDADGCEPDEDSDGIADRQDDCPGTAAGTQVDINGCEIREEIKLPGVNFETNSDRLVPGAESVLNDAAATLERNPGLRVEVAGHTDSDGAADYNDGLSERRAETVRDYLIRQGVAGDRMTVRGYGESQPIESNDTAAGKAANRRVVLRVLER